MPRRNRWRVGDWLMVDQESGRVHYASEMVKRWDGVYVRADQNEFRNPQEFVRARKDPAPLTDISPAELADAAFLGLGAFIGNTNVPAITDGPASHLFNGGIGKMIIGRSFFVR